MRKATGDLRLQPVKPIISVKEARKLMGKSGEKMSTDEVKQMISDYEALARYAIREYLVLK